MRQNMTNNCLINYKSLSDTNLSQHYFCDNFKNQTPTKENKKRVRFYNDVYVMLIPSIIDYQRSNMCDDLWWSKHDLIRFSKQYKQHKLNTVDS